MLHHGSPTEDNRQMTTPVTPCPDTGATHAPDPSGDASPAAAPAGGDRQLPEAGTEGRPARPSPGPSVEKDRRRVRPARWAARDAAVSGTLAAAEGERVEEECGRERLKRHRVAMAGRVWIPDTWGQESLLKDWVDCAGIGRALVPSGLISAREALVDECRREETGGRFWIESSYMSA